MSRSYKKTPYCGDSKGKDKKRIANHAIRRALNRDPELVMQHKAYRKYYETYNICDYYFFCTWEEYWRSELRTYHWLLANFPNRHNSPPNKKESYRRWLKWYRNK